jgi:hypothetical protein
VLAPPAAASQPRSATALRHAGLEPRAAARAGYVHSSLECSFQSSAVNVNLDCGDLVLPTAEQDVVVDPTDPRHVVVSSLDYASSGDEWYTTLNGHRWWSGDMSLEGTMRFGSDPVTTIEPRTGTVIHASVNYRVKGGDIAGASRSSSRAASATTHRSARPSTTSPGW